MHVCGVAQVTVLMPPRFDGYADVFHVAPPSCETMIDTLLETGPKSSLSPPTATQV
jgi:hypothetical protein